MTELASGLTTVDAAVLVRDIAAVFRAVGMRNEDAEQVAEAIVEADLRGVHSHGTAMVPWYVSRFADPGVNPGGRPRIVSDHRAAIVVDGDNAMGHLVASYSMDVAIDRARALGVGVVAARGSNHCGAMAVYASRATDVGMIGIAASHAVPSMAPWAGVDRIVGANPVAIAIPTGRHAPFLYDGSFSQVARGKIALHAAAHEQIPEAWAFDADGRQTTDPAAALAGLLQPIGGAKGIGMALAVGILATALSGATYGTRLGSVESGARAGEDGHLFLAIDVAAFTPLDEFGSRVDAVIDEIHKSRPRRDGEQPRVPDERAAERRRASLDEGVPLPASSIDGLRDVARRLGVHEGSS